MFSVTTMPRIRASRKKNVRKLLPKDDGAIGATSGKYILAQKGKKDYYIIIVK